MSYTAHSEGGPELGCVVLTRSVEDNRRTAKLCREEGFRTIQVPMLEYANLEFDLDLIPDDLDDCIVLLTSSRATRRWIDLRIENDVAGSIPVVAYIVVGSSSADLLGNAEPDARIWRSSDGVESIKRGLSPEEEAEMV